MNEILTNCNEKLIECIMINIHKDLQNKNKMLYLIFKHILHKTILYNKLLNLYMQYLCKIFQKKMNL